MRLELPNLIAEHVGSVVDATKDTHTAGVGDGRGQLGPGCHVHAGKQNGVVDLEKIGDGGSDLLCEGASFVSHQVNPSGGVPLEGRGNG